MTFATPAALFWLALTVPIVVLYILKVRLRRVPVSTNLFWKQIYEEKPPRSIWQYLRHLLSLLLQLALLALLAFAVAEPLLSWQLSQARRVVLVVDRSASMQASDVPPTRFAAAIEAGRRYIEGLRDRDEMAIVLAGARPEVAVGMNSHIPSLKRVLDALEPTDGPTQLDSAIELGQRLIGDHPHGQIVVLTDGCVNQGATRADVDETPTSTSTATAEPDGDISAEGAPPPSIDYRVFATRAANVGITQFQVRRSLVDPLGYEVLAEVHNAADTPLECRLELELDGLPVDILPLKLTPDETWSRSIEKTSLDGGTLTARLTEIRGQLSADETTAETSSTQPSTPNLLTVDDSAWAI
ncbi:MAG: BatA and WFA domain-containing protein, partial [Planctomycetaceae bacterium]|nr:BatA and WFA domain-containing protein [Planctomycetaceae bacterium]